MIFYCFQKYSIMNFDRHYLQTVVTITFLKEKKYVQT